VQQPPTNACTSVKRSDASNRKYVCADRYGSSLQCAGGVASAVKSQCTWTKSNMAGGPLTLCCVAFGDFPPRWPFSFWTPYVRL